METYYSRLVAHSILNGRPKKNYLRKRVYRERKWEEIPIEDYSDSKVKIKRERGRTIWDFTTDRSSESKEDFPVKTKKNMTIDFPDSPVECLAVWLSSEYYYFPISIEGERFYMDNFNYVYEHEPMDVFSIPFMKYEKGKLIDLD
jgi:hypothetical protein